MTTSRFHISRSLMRVRRVVRNDQSVFSVLALIVGSAVGGAVILFREGIDLFQYLFFQIKPDALNLAAAFLPWWQKRSNQVCCVAVACPARPGSRRLL